MRVCHIIVLLPILSNCAISVCNARTIDTVYPTGKLYAVHWHNLMGRKKAFTAGWVSSSPRVNGRINCFTFTSRALKWTFSASLHSYGSFTAPASMVHGKNHHIFHNEIVMPWTRFFILSRSHFLF